MVKHKSLQSPCPNLEQAIKYARKHGTAKHPVTVSKRGEVLYTWPEQ